MKTTKFKLTDRGWMVVGILGGLALIGIILLAGWMEASL